MPSIMALDRALLPVWNCRGGDGGSASLLATQSITARRDNPVNRLDTPFTQKPNKPAMTINVTAPSQVIATQSTAAARVNLLNRFDDPFTTGLVARFELYDSSLAGGVTEVVLFDQPGQGAPKTVANFQAYVDDDAYRNSIIHRSIPDFVVQGGGFTTTDISSVQEVDANEPVENEFRADRSNTRGTLAMAKVGGDPDSATSQWFFNVDDNSSNLDNQNGGFTVFGEVRGDSDLAVIDAISALPVLETTAFSDLPVIADDPANPVVNSLDDLVRYRNIRVSEVDELEFAVVSNSNPGLLTATIANNDLVLNYVPGQTGETTLVVEATNLLGETVQDSITLTVLDQPSFSGTGESDELLGSNANNRLRGRAGNDTLLGFGGRDRLIGGGGRDDMSGGAGRDILLGGGGRDTLGGGGGRDTLRGGGSKDSLNGGGGNDELDGGAGSDRMDGGRGKDRFVLRKGSGRDTIVDFKNGQDTLQVRGVSFADLSITQRGQNTLIRTQGDALAILNDVRANTITRADFA